jgi:hypothetical protein
VQPSNTLLITLISVSGISSVPLNLLQFRKPWEPIVVNEAGNVNEPVKNAQLSNALGPMVCTPLPNDRVLLNPVHPVNALFPIDVTVSGIVSDPVNPVQDSNVPFPIVWRVLGNVNAPTNRVPLNAEFPILVRLGGNIKVLVKVDTPENTLSPIDVSVFGNLRELNPVRDPVYAVNELLVIVI